MIILLQVIKDEILDEGDFHSAKMFNAPYISSLTRSVNPIPWYGKLLMFDRTFRLQKVEWRGWLQIQRSIQRLWQHSRSRVRICQCGRRRWQSYGTLQNPNLWFSSTTCRSLRRLRVKTPTGRRRTERHPSWGGQIHMNLVLLLSGIAGLRQIAGLNLSSEVK